MEANRENEMEIDIRDIVHLLISRIWLILLGGVILAGLTGVICKFVITPTYSSTTQLCIVGSNTTLTSLTDLQIGTQLTKDYIVVTQSRPVVEEVINNLGLDMTFEQLLRVTTISNPADTRILRITVTDDDPFQAKQIADQYAQVSRKRIAEIMDIAEPGIIEEGYVNEEPIAPASGRNTVIAEAVGMILMALFFIIRYILDDTIKSSEDIEKYLGLNTLALLPFEESGLDVEEQEKKENARYKRNRRQKKGAAS